MTRVFAHVSCKPGFLLQAMILLQFSNTSQNHDYAHDLEPHPLFFRMPQIVVLAVHSQQNLRQYFIGRIVNFNYISVGMIFHGRSAVLDAIIEAHRLSWS